MINANAKRIAARGCEFIVGLYFLIGAVPKALDINRFSVQMSAYHVITNKAYLPWFALATLFAEMSLGTALLLGLRLRGLTILCLQLMLAFFTVLILYAWLVHGLEDCGCFPLVKMTPPVSIAKNVVLFVFGCIAWQVLVRRSAASVVGTGIIGDTAGKNPTWHGAALRFVIAFVAAAAAVAYAAPRVEHIKTTPPAGTAKETKAGIDYSQFSFMTDMGSFDLGKGTYLVPILSMTCDECKSHVPQLNDLMSQPDMPPMVALCYEDDPGDLDKFRGETQPLFPLHALGNQPLLYFNLRGDGHFRLTLVRDGRTLANWDDKVPAADAVTAALKPAASPAAK
jgi:hypothetical protein